MPAELLPFIAPLGTAAIALASALLVFRLNQRHQLQLEALKDARALRDARRVRLSTIYETALVAAVGMDHFTSAFRMRPVGWDINQDQEALAAVFRDTDLARARLLVEADARPVSVEFEQLFREFTALRGILEERIGDPQVRLKDIELRSDSFQARSDRLRAAIHNSLAPLDEPIRSLSRARSRPRWAFWR